MATPETPLSEKDAAFAQAVAGGASLSDVYSVSRDCSRMATSTINANAKKLAKKPHVNARIDKLRRESRSQSVPTLTFGTRF